jgi:hypothetical protein
MLLLRRIPFTNQITLRYLQGPYTNALDLQLFPAMSKRHSELLQLYNNTEV